MSVEHWISIIAITIFILGAVATYAVMMVTCWWMKHNIPELWQENTKLKEQIHALEKQQAIWSKENPFLPKEYRERLEALEGETHG